MIFDGVEIGGHRFNRDDITIIAMLRQFYPQPSVREMAKYLGTVESTVRYRMMWLEIMGYIERVGNRAVAVTEKGEEIYPEFVVIVREKVPPPEPVPIST